MRRILVSLVVGFGMAAALLGLLNARPTAAQGVIYVNQTASGSNDGSSWDDAYTDLQDALVAASAGGEIWVATGVYTPTAGVTRTARFTLTPGVALYGGFAGNEDDRDDRDWETNVTVLSGDIDGDDTNTDGNHIAEVYSDTVGANAYHVLWLDGVTNETITETTVIDGFTITAGQADGSYPNDCGGGMYCNGSGIGNECNPTLTDVTFSGNQANGGGGMFNDGFSGVSSPDLTNVTFNGNQAGAGGGMYNYGRDGVSSPTLANVTFSGNQASNGGGMYNDGFSGGASPALTNVTFSGNQAAYGGGMYNYGTNGESSPALTNVTFSGNHAGAGGGMFNTGSGGESRPMLTNVTFSGNHANVGGGISNHGGSESSPTLVNCILWGNTASTAGPQIYNTSATPIVTYSDVQWPSGGVYTGTGNINHDPQFVTPVTATLAPTISGNYRLQLGSPAIDAGNNLSVTVTTDRDGGPRIVGGTVDMGAYETAVYIYLPLVVRNHDSGQ